MGEFTRSVTVERVRTRVADENVLFVETIEWLRASGRLGDAEEALQVERQGGFPGFDLLMLLMAYFCAGRGLTSMKNFSALCSTHRAQLAAAVDREEWATASVVSRFLSAAKQEDADRFTAWALGPGSYMDQLLAEPATWARDTLGQPWHFLDFDPVNQVLRQRQLPMAEGLPTPKRRAKRLCKAGYPGRKRGETQVSHSRLQHAGSGFWLFGVVTPGNARGTPELLAGLDPALQRLAKFGIPSWRCIVRTDGAIGSPPCLQALNERNTRFLSRLRNYTVFDRDDVRAFVNQATWYEVPDSLSGPRRHATELGTWRLQAARTASDEEPVSARLVVSRFWVESGEGHGAGITIEHWHYEFFETDLDSSAWPAPELVQAYYGRCGQENRFAQMNRELHVNHVLSANPAGQQIALAVAMWLWNLQIVRGAEMMAPLAAPAPQALRAAVQVVDTVILPLVQPDAADAQAPAAVAIPQELAIAGTLPVEQPASASETVVSLPTEVSAASLESAAATQPKPQLSEVPSSLDQLPWNSLLAKYPGWCFVGGNHLQCPINNPAPLHNIRIGYRDQPTAVFRVARTHCRDCPNRKGCTTSTDHHFQKEVNIQVPKSIAVMRKEILEQTATGRPAWRPVLETPPLPPPRWTPPAPSQPGKFEAQLPLFLPAALRHLVRDDTVHMEIRVLITGAPPPAKPVLYLAESPGGRQHRRKTWKERHAANALPATTKVHIAVTRYRCAAANKSALQQEMP